jgi:hypothetical protein
MFDSVAMGVLVGMLTFTPVSDSQPLESNFIRLGKNARYDIAMDSKSIKVDWGNGVDFRKVHFNLRFSPTSQDTILVAGKQKQVSNYVVSTSTNCGNLRTVISKIRIYVGPELVDIGSWGGPLGEWNGFGERAAGELANVVCSPSTGKRRVNPAMT